MTTPRSRRAFTLPEVLVVCGVIALLVAILLPALAGAMRTSKMAKSKTRMREIATWMQAYSSENREYIVPSHFDYTASAATYAVKVRSDVDLPAAERFHGTWTDILWVYGGLGAKQALFDPSQPTNEDKYVFDSPDRAVYVDGNNYDSSPFRAAELNSHDYGGGNGVATPFGPGATESGYPGYFAANNYFNTDPADPVTALMPAQWFTTGQIKAPDRSMYLVDSVAGETINPDGAVNGPWDNPSVDPSATAAAPNLQADFRYNGACLMMFLDGHSDAVYPWRNLAEVEGQRKIKVTNLTKN